MRSGTLNVPSIVGFGKAAELAAPRWRAKAKRLLALRDRLREGIQAQLTDTYVNGSMEHRLPGNLNISFAYVEGEAMMMAHQGRGGLVGLGLHLGLAGAVVRAARAGRRGRAGAHLDSLRPRPLQHRGRGRLRGRVGGGKVNKLRELSPALRDGAGGDRL